MFRILYCIVVNSWVFLLFFFGYVVCIFVSDVASYL